MGKDPGQDVLRLSLSDPFNVQPLQRVHVASNTPGWVVVRDGEHRIYKEFDLHSEAEFIVGGALGTHSINLYGHDQKLLAQRMFRTSCTTHVDDNDGPFGKLLKNCYWTMCTDGPVRAMRFHDQIFTFWDSWLMDNTQTLKGMKYFWPDVTSNVDFYAHSQREDGMIWENFESRIPYENYWDWVFQYADFSRSAENGFLQLRRAPVENHVEAFFVEALYFAWKASGDTAWMTQHLNAALKAVHYATNDPYRWSEKFRLLKRGFTIDTWDFLVDSEAKIAGDNIMRVVLDKTHFGIFFGDNTNFIAGLIRLAEMLDAAGLSGDATQARATAGEMQSRIDKLSWNGEFYRHWIAEDPDFKLDLGVDLDRQVALSNAYTLNRTATHQQAVAIVRTYQRIRAEMPSSSPGEFYAIYPPFERGFGGENAKWEYMNGGVMSCVAGELARGAFDHGFEAYGADILQRQQKVAERFRGVVPGILRGKSVEEPPRTFTHMSLANVANASFAPEHSGKDVTVWMGDPDNALPGVPTGDQKFRSIPFRVLDPSANAGRACLAISSSHGFSRQASVEVGAKARSLYLLHTIGGDDLAGKLRVLYADGSSSTEYIRKGINVGTWWEPRDREFENTYVPQELERYQVAWRGANSRFKNLGIYVSSFPIEHVERKIKSIEFQAMENGAKWMIIAATLSDSDPWLPPYSEMSFGMPNNWGAAAIVFALLEGLAGIKDAGIAFNSARVAPRWAASDTSQCKVAVCYPASSGYVAYNYQLDPSRRLIQIEVTSSGDYIELSILLPQNSQASQARVDGAVVQHQITTVEVSAYLNLNLRERGAHTITVDLK
ncbi:hypothetical protein [Occallatibacter savannae]|uniref:hypothetical protein n=1 Tax=Occallatibacter savannae TaxID=1002691 RepID=UPI000D69C245|nr:hypothetical protein [Occallatibacter savannae]